MEIEQFFNRDCETIFQKHKFYLERKTAFTSDNNVLSFEDFPAFTEVFETFQIELAEKIEEYAGTLQNPDMLKALEPIAQYHIVAFLNMVGLPKLELPLQ